jgi:hypothetical protein
MFYRFGMRFFQADRKDWSGHHLSDLGMHWLQPIESLLLQFRAER